MLYSSYHRLLVRVTWLHSDKLGYFSNLVTEYSLTMISNTTIMSPEILARFTIIAMDERSRSIRNDISCTTSLRCPTQVRWQIPRNFMAGLANSRLWAATSRQRKPIPPHRLNRLENDQMLEMQQNCLLRRKEDISGSWLAQILSEMYEMQRGSQSRTICSTWQQTSL